MFYKPKQSEKLDPFIYGKDSTSCIVGMEVEEKDIILYRRVDGKMVRETKPNTYWIVNPTAPDKLFKPLEGDLFYKHIKTTSSRSLWMSMRKKYPASWSVWDKRESAMIFNGLTFFKEMVPENLTVLGFDIEAYGLLDFDYKKTYIIANTFRDSNGRITRRQFSLDDYDNDEGKMIAAWCEWVRKADPDVLTGHNIHGYDLEYLRQCALKYDLTLDLGREGQPISWRNDKFRYDGAQTWEYNRFNIYGRQIIDTMFLAMKHDVGRNYPTWKIKDIIEFEADAALKKLTRGKPVSDALKRIVEGQKDRVYYDAATIKDNWDNPTERKLIKEYCIDDGDDALNYFDHAIPSRFFLAQSVPKSFADIVDKATGSQVNATLVRAYLQKGHSLPKASESNSYEGAISIGVPGVYKNCFKVDLQSMYPNIIRQYEIYDKDKDPLKALLHLTEAWTVKRLEHKRIANETGSTYDRGMEQALKIAINSIYGFMNAKGLLFNSPDNAAKVTEIGRDILIKAMKWSTGNDLDYWKNKGV